MPKLHTLFAIPVWLLGSTIQPAAAHENYGKHRPVQQQLARPSQQQDQPEFKPGTLGVCGLHQVSGYLAVTPDGQMVPLSQYCQQQQNWVWSAESDFWQEFRAAATPETVVFAQSLDRHEVEAYAHTICTFLDDGATLQEIQSVQSDQQLPASFERAVTIAAIKANCRQYRSKLAELP